MGAAEQSGEGEVAARLQRVEERLAFLERHNEAQDKALWAADREVVRLAEEVRRLRARLAALGEGAADEGASPADERPPHY